MRLLTIFLLILLALTIQASSRDVVDQLHKQAYELLDVDLDSAMKIAEQSLKLSEKEDYQWGIANSYYIKGYIFKQQNILAKAFLMYLKSSEVLHKLDDERAAKTHTSVLLNSGAILRKYSQYEAAIEFYDKGLKVANDWDFVKQQLKLQYNKASSLRKKGELQTAMELLKETASLAHSLEDHGQLLKCFNLLGLIHKDNGFFTEAREYYQYILESPHGSPKDRALAYHNLAIAYNDENQSDTSKAYFEKALKLKRTFDHPEVLFITLHDLAKWHLKFGDIDQADKYAVEAESLYSSLSAEPKYFDIFHVLDTLSHVRTSYDQSQLFGARYYQESQTFMSHQEEILRQLKSFQIDLIIARHEAELQKAEAQQEISRLKILILSILLALAGVLLVYIYIKRYIIREELTKVIKSLHWSN
ncbi:MAG: tetratricopeptide repeat protein [Cytophagales bacterium]|nr:tetratricopeptide repeat protein [Cytophagales bacterium]